MNQIEKLIAEHCPAGVAFTMLGDVCNVLRGTRLTKKELSDNGKYAVYHGGVVPLGHYNEFNRSGNKTMIINTGSVGEVAYSFNDFWSSDGTFTIETPDNINDRYIYFVLLTKEAYLKAQKRAGGVPTISREVVEKIKIPIPPLPVQEAIVEVLDSFTELAAELEAELEARRKQYEYYRSNLLTFDNDVKRMQLGDIGDVLMCRRVFKSQTSAVGDIPFYKIGTFGKIADTYISKDLYDEYRNTYSFPKKGDVLISASGTIGRTVIYDGCPAYFQDSNIVWIDNDESIITNKFLYYLYQITSWKIEGSTISRLYNSNLKKITIPTPPIPEQERIIAILEKFDALVNDISIGLPAELAARRRQYEYYRDKLLTFKPASEQ